jgi:RNA polymerase sigma factor (sigma-70 family)
MTPKEFENIYNQYFWLIYKYVKERLNHDVYNTQEVVAYVFMKLWEAKPKLKSKSDIIGWLGLAAKRRIIDVSRSLRTHRYTPIDEVELDESDEQQMELYLIEQGVIEQILKLVTNFTPNEQAIFNLYYIDSLSTPKIANKLNLSASTIRSYLQIIRDKIKSKIKKGQYE